MRCEDVHAELARDAVAPDRRDAIASHLATCARCRRLRALLEHMDVTLRGGPVWTLPEGFAERNALRGSRLVVQASTRTRERIVPRALRAATLGVLVAAATYLGADALDTLGPVTGEFVSDRTATVLDAYTRAFGGAATTVVANAALLAWASAALSVSVAMRVTRCPLL